MNRISKIILILLIIIVLFSIFYLNGFSQDDPMARMKRSKDDKAKDEQKLNEKGKKEFDKAKADFKNLKDATFEIAPNEIVNEDLKSLTGVPNTTPDKKLADQQTEEGKKKQKEIKAKSTKVVLKEVRFGPNTDEHDYLFKLKHAQKFLSEGAKVKAYVFFKGRSILYKEQGEEVLHRFVKDLEDFAKLDQEPKLEGKRMIIQLSPLPKKK